MSTNIKLRLIEISGHVLYEGLLIRMALKDSVVKAKSIEFFQDPEPCMIHRSAVMSRLYEELVNFFQECKINGNYHIRVDGIPYELVNYIDISELIWAVDIIS